MSIFFQQQYEKEFLRSEALRVRMSLGIFLFGSAGSFTNYLFIATDSQDEFGRDSILAVFLMMVSLACFEMLSLLFLRHQIKNKSGLAPLWLRYFNSFIEVSAVSATLFLIAQQMENPYRIFSSPLSQIYFLFIVLSTLRLDFRLSAFVALIAALEFSVLHQTIVTRFPQPGLPQEIFLSVSRSMPIFITGIASAVVTAQIHRTVHRSVTELERGQQLVNLFGQQVSREIVEEMLLSDGQLESRKSKVCIMFIDIRNFTSHVIGKTPAEVVEYQNAFFSIIIEAVTKRKGIVNQFLGDGCMITFGAPVHLANPCRDAVETALEIRNILVQHSEDGRITPTRVGIGIHTGEVITGNIGTSLRQQYSVTGSAVILAARLEQLNKEFTSEILVSGEVMSELRGLSLNSELLGPVSVKGWEQPVIVHKLA